MAEFKNCGLIVFLGRWSKTDLQGSSEISPGTKKTVVGQMLVPDKGVASEVEHSEGNTLCVGNEIICEVVISSEEAI